MTATIGEAPTLGASEPRHISAILGDFAREMLAREPEPLAAAEAEAIVRDFLAREMDPPRPRAGARWCRCARPWEFERGHCTRCGHDLRAVGV
jgi:hypothetical protein